MSHVQRFARIGMLIRTEQKALANLEYDIRLNAKHRVAYSQALNNHRAACSHADSIKILEAQCAELNSKHVELSAKRTEKTRWINYITNYVM